MTTSATTQKEVFELDLAALQDDIPSLKGTISVRDDSGVAVMVSPERRVEEILSLGGFREFEREAYVLLSGLTAYPAIKDTITLDTLDSVADGTKYYIENIEQDGVGVKMSWRRRS